MLLTKHRSPLSFVLKRCKIPRFSLSNKLLSICGNSHEQRLPSQPKSEEMIFSQLQVFSSPFLLQVGGTVAPADTMSALSVISTGPLIAKAIIAYYNMHIVHKSHMHEFPIIILGIVDTGSTVILGRNASDSSGMPTGNHRSHAYFIFYQTE